MRILIIMTLLCFTVGSKLKAQTNKYEIRFNVYENITSNKDSFIEQINVYSFDVKNKDLIIKIKKNKYIYTICFSDTLYKGNAIVYQYDFNGNIKGIFQYRDGVEILKEQILCSDVDISEPIVCVNEYFEAIPTGTWFYYKKNGKLKKTIEVNWKVYVR